MIPSTVTFAMHSAIHAPSHQIIVPPAQLIEILKHHCTILKANVNQVVNLAST